MSSMSAVVLTSRGIDGLELAERPVPQVAPGEVLTRVHACGVGGTILNKVNGMADRELPRVPGHEFVGEVVDVGAGVHDPQPGDLVMGYYYVTCGRCRYCRTGRAPLCDNHGRGDDRVGENRDGSFAEYIALPARNVLPVPAGLGTVEATVAIDALATPVHICARTGLSEGERLLVIGAAGGVGIHLVQFAGLRGADVVAVDRADKLDAITEYAPRATTVTAEDEWSARLRHQVDVVVDLVGTAETAAAGLEVLARGGRLVVLAPGSGKVLHPDKGEMIGRELSLLGSKYASHEQVMIAARMLERGLVQPVVTDSGPLDSAARQLERSRQERPLAAVSWSSLLDALAPVPGSSVPRMRGIDTMTIELTEDERKWRPAEQFRHDVIEPLEPHKAEWVEDPVARFPWAAVEAGSALGFRTMSVPQEFGGTEGSMLAHALVIEEIAMGDMGLAVIFDQTCKVARTILGLATDEQRDWFLEQFLPDPRCLLAVGLAEPAHTTEVWLSRWLLDSGDHRVQLDTTALLDDGAWVISGAKAMPSLASTAKLALLIAQTEPDEPLHEGATYFLFRTDTPGFEATHVFDKMSQRLADNARMEFEDLRVPVSQQLGERGHARRTSITGGGNITAAATTLGTARAALEQAIEFARNRMQGGKPIIEHQAIGMKLAAMVSSLQAARSLIWQAARAYDAGDTTTPLQWMAKWTAAETAAKVCVDALSVVGSAGIMRDNPMQKYLRDCMSFLHSDGTQEGRLILIQEQLVAGRDLLTPNVDI